MDKYEIKTLKRDNNHKNCIVFAIIKVINSKVIVKFAYSILIPDDYENFFVIFFNLYIISKLSNK
jgi:hypothetical protein